MTPKNIQILILPNLKKRNFQFCQFSRVQNVTFSENNIFKTGKIWFLERTVQFWVTVSQVFKSKLKMILISKVFVGSPCTLNTPGFYQISTKNACIHRTRYILIFIISDCSTKTYKSSPISWTNTNVQSRVIFKTFCPILSFGRLNITDICQILWLTKCAINTIPRKFDKVSLPKYRGSRNNSPFLIPCILKFYRLKHTFYCLFFTSIW